MRKFIFVLIVALAANGAVLAQDDLRVGILLDGPWDRDQAATANIMRTVRSALEGSRNVTFPDNRRVTGDWTAQGVKDGLDQLLRDQNVDMIFTLGVLGSHEAAGRNRLSKPVIAAQIVQPQWLKVPSRVSGTSFSDRTLVSGVGNLTYITEVGVNLPDKVALLRQIVPFNKIAVLAAEPFKELSSDIEGGLTEILTPLNLAEIKVIFVGSTIGSALRAIPEDTDAVFVTAIPQMEGEEFQRLATTLIDMQLPAFTTGDRNEVELGLLAGVVAPKAAEAIAERIASLVKAIVDGTNASDLPVELAVEESLSFNNGVASALGLLDENGQLKASADATATGVADGDSRNASMSTVGDNPPSPIEQEEIQKISENIQRGLARITSYGAFDIISFQIQGRKVILLGYAWRPTTSQQAERIAQRTDGVETVENNIEVLPTSNADDRIRGSVFASIYGHSTMQRFLRGGGLSRFDVQQTLQQLRFGIENVDIVRGPQAVHILVRNGHVALVGNVQTQLQKQVSEAQALSTPGVFSVENHINTAGSN